MKIKSPGQLFPGKRVPGQLAFSTIFVTVLIDIIGFGIIIPVMPDLLTQVTQLSPAKAVTYSGYLMMIFALTQFISTPILGALSDHFGRRPVILLSLLGYVVDFMIMGLAKSFTILFFGRIFSGIFAATHSTANAYIADITPSEERAVRFGMLGAAFGVGFIIGPAIGGILGAYYGPRAPFFAAAGLAAINLVYCFFVLPETLTKENRRPFDWKRANPLGNLIQLQRYPVMLPILIAMFLFNVAHFALQATWSWYGKVKFDWGPDFIGYSLMAVGISAAIVQGGLIKTLLARLGERKCVILGGLATAFAYIAYAYVPYGWMVYPVILVGAFGGILQPALQGIMSRTIPADSQGELQGAIASLMSVAMIFGPIIMTRTFSIFTVETAPIYFPGAPFLLAGLLVIISAIPLRLAFKNLAKRENQ